MAELLGRISSQELTEWMALFEMDRFGETNMEYRAALITSMIANGMRDPEQHREAYAPAEFMRPEFLGTTARGKRKRDHPSQTDLDQRIMAIFGAMSKGDKG